MLGNTAFNKAAQPYTPPVRSIGQINSIPEKYRSLILDTWKIEEGSDLVSADTAKWALSRADFMSLSTTHDENDKFMRLLAKTVTGPKIDNQYPYSALGVGTWGTEKKDGEIIKALIKYLKETPYVTVSVASNFPYGKLSPKKAAASVARATGWMENYAGDKEVVTALNYDAWVNGKKKLAKETVEAEVEAARAAGATLRVAQVAQAHRLSEKQGFYKSLYASTKMCLEAGVECIDTSTDKAVDQPHSDDVSRDAFTPETILPVLAAVADFNKKNKTQRRVRISGGLTSVVDAARVQHMVKEIMGEEALGTVVLGSSYMFPFYLRDYIRTQEGEQSKLTKEDCEPVQKKVDLPPGMQGLTG